jgi:Rps23 Pro-64 3,4-dihydroxylase Tpa1-like proline 4-hydroxylase
MKRKAEKQTAPASNGKNKNKKQATESNAVEAQFGDGLFAQKTLKGYTDDYASSAPYKHAVVHGLMNDSLLRSVRTEIIDNIHFTPKETDIYKIHQSGDLANLSGLPESALEKLPSLLKLRNALYGPEFREWISTVAGSGPLSGKKTDMAVNVYVPGCHLLCHDDVIGSRRVSYILYLTDPDKPWQANWGGALRLYPTDDEKGEDGKTYKVPRAEFSKVIPPAWNQLSFFAVQPGESFHDVEEVYHRAEGVEEDDGGRVRMAISGWSTFLKKARKVSSRDSRRSWPSRAPSNNSKARATNLTTPSHSGSILKSTANSPPRPQTATTTTKKRQNSQKRTCNSSSTT